MKHKSVLCLLAGSIQFDSRVRRHLRYLAQSGCRVTLVSTDADPAGLPEGTEHLRWQAPRTAQAAARKVAPVKSRLYFAVKICYIAYLNLSLYFRLRRRTFDVYLANDFETLPAAARLSRKSGGQLVFDSHEIYTEQLSESPPFFKKILSTWERRCLRPGDRVMTISETMAAEIQKRNRLERMPDVVRNVPESPPVFHPEARKRRSLLYHGYLSEGRGLPELVEAMVFLPDVRLTLRGEGRLKDRLEALKREKNLEDRVTVEALVSHEDLIAEAAVFDVGVALIQPSCLNHELSLPNKIYEYLYAGLAVIATDLPEMRRVIHEHGVGITLTRTDPAALAEAIRRLFSDEARLKQCQRNAYELSCNEFETGAEKKSLRSVFGLTGSEAERLTCAVL